MASLHEQSELMSAASKPRLLFDIDDLDLSARILGRDDLAKWNPHRGEMAMLDWLVWEAEGPVRAVGLKHVREDEFWVPGHFPNRPMLPGVLQVEVGAQIACYLYNSRKPEPTLAAFLRIENAVFRNMVVPGDDLFVLCQEVKFGRRRFVTDVQGIVERRVAFEARISGMEMGRAADLST